MGKEPSDELVPGTLAMLILKTLSPGEPMHGYAIANTIQQTSAEILKVDEGALYPALHRLERRGWIKASWGTSDNNRRAKYYELTKKGRARLETEISAWRKLSAVVSQVIESV